MNSHKTYGGTRNYAHAPSTLRKRRDEYNRLMNSGDYDPERSKFYPSGGFYAVHRYHNNPESYDAEEKAASVLAEKGYKIYLGDERNTISGKSVNDGNIYHSRMDIKAITEVGPNTIKSRLEKATKQGATTAILVQTRSDMTRAYVEGQIQKFKEFSPARARAKLEYVIVVGMNGSVHRHKLK